MIPIFSFLLSQLLFEVSISAKDTATINTYGGIVVGVAAFDGLLMGFKYFIMERSAVRTVLGDAHLFKLLLSQDKKWFDKSENTAVRMVQVLIKDGNDVRNLIAVVLGQCLIVVAMFAVGNWREDGNLRWSDLRSRPCLRLLWLCRRILSPGASFRTNDRGRRLPKVTTRWVSFFFVPS